MASVFSCTNKFEEMNDNPWTSNEMDPKFQFTYIQNKPYTDAGECHRTNLIMAGPMSQATGNLYAVGEGFGVAYTEAPWNNIYKDVLKNITDLEKNLIPNSAQLGQVKIVKVIDMLKVTQLYGDAPYSEAGLGYTEHVLYPKYDTQQELFENMVTDLKAGRDMLENGETFTDDFYYSGNKDLWKKLANAMLMKIGLFMSESDPSRASEVFKEGYNHSAGYISTLTETAKIEHSNNGGAWGGHMNGGGAAMTSQAGGHGYGYISETALKSMQSRKDPRLFYVAGVLDASVAPTEMVYPTDNFDPFEMAENWGEAVKPVSLRGTRMGDQDGQIAIFAISKSGNTSDASTIIADYYGNKNGEGKYITYPGGTSLKEGGNKFTLASLNNETILNPLSPTLVMSSDEVHFMIAEAIEKKIIGGNSTQHLEQGIRDAMKKYQVFYPGQEYAETAINAYKTTSDNKAYTYESAMEEYISQAMQEYNSSSNKLDNIIYQAWVSQIGNGIATFALWNRTHLPSFVDPILDQGKYEYIDIPVYTEDIRNLYIEGKDLPAPIGKKTINFHSPGSTSFVRSRRFDYPNNEMSSNTTNYQEAVDRQRSASNNTNQFNTVDMWMSYKSTFSNSKGIELIKE